MDTELILKFFSSIAVGLLVSYFASKFPLRKFKEEKVRDERKDAIEAFEELVHWAEQVRASHRCEPVIGGDARFDESLRKISKYRATGGLIFSNEFNGIVKESNMKYHRFALK